MSVGTRLPALGLLLAAGCKRAPVDVEVQIAWEAATPLDVERYVAVPVEHTLNGLPD
ncbi:MAG: hypothetical protein JST54_09200 [Deltaproteobacteria bacterium]|nr:hypothetical protein [Deltaproteobacteria bacterium]